MISEALHVGLGFAQCIFLTTLSVLINMVFGIIPGSLGVMEGGYGILLKLYGLNPALGVAIQLIRRVRLLFWTLLGMIIVGFKKKRLRGVA